jgi:hypothetical protein
MSRPLVLLGTVASQRQRATHSELTQREKNGEVKINGAAREAAGKQDAAFTGQR